MSPRSFEKFNYTLRPAKNIERKMLVEVFGRFSAICPLPRYRYIGFGSISFKDFVLVHQRLGLRDMISMEEAEEDRDRFRFNRPYSCISIKWGTSSEVLPRLTWNKRAILWLDYDKYLNASKLADIAMVVTSVQSGSILAVTVDVDSDRVGKGPEAPAKRMSLLRDLVGVDKIPRGVKGNSLAGWGMSRVCREIIQNEILRALSDRNAPQPSNKRLAYHQLFNICYADNAKMLTVGGYFVDPTDASLLSPEQFLDLDFVRPGQETYLIEVPILTWREATHLNWRLPRSAPAVALPKWLPENERRRYGKVYRHYPTYLEAEF
jgi:hypothetical protein